MFAPCFMACGGSWLHLAWGRVMENDKGRERVHRELFRSINQPAERMLQAPLTPLAPAWTWEAQRLSLPPPPIHPSSLGMI